MAKRLNTCLGQQPLWTPASEWRPPDISKLPSWTGARRVCVDTETRDPKLKTLGPGVRRDGYMVGISFAIEDGPSFYLPIAHPEDNCNPEHVFAYLRDQFKTYDGDLVGANIGYDLDYLWEKNIEMPKVKRYRDIQVADVLINELFDSYSLDNIAKRLGMPGKDETLLRDAASAYHLDPKKGLWQLPGRFVGPYACQDVVLPLQVLRRQERLIEEAGLEQIYDLETRLTPCLVKMRRRGVKVDMHKLQQVEEWSITEAKAALEKVRELTGCRIGIEDLNKAKALAPAIEAIGSGVQLKRTAAGAISIDKDFLSGVKHPVADALLRARKMDKVRGTFCASVRQHLVKGRIHATFNQLRRTSDSEGEDDKGARYGRLSCTDPNLQQQPARDPEIGKLWRSIYVPDDGALWAAMDYSQQEPRMAVHYGVRAGCTGAEAMAHAFRTDPKCDNHTTMALICGIQRKYAKEIFLGLCYGMGGAKLCRKLGKPTAFKHSKSLNKMIEVAGPEGQAILDQVDQKMPYLKQLAKMCENRAKERKYVITLLGRHCHFPVKADGTVDWAHKALNRIIQGSSADQTKMAIVLMCETLEVPQLQVHDEVDTSVEDAAHAEKFADIMRNCVPLEVPSKVDVELGKSWGESMG